MTSTFYSQRLWLPGLGLIAIILFSSAGSGCIANGPSRVRLHSLDTGRVYAQQFKQAYFAQRPSGEYEVVLIDDTAAQAGKTKRGQPLQASASSPLRQVVHIRIHWRPPHGTRPDHPSATNAVVDWYVNAGTAASEDRLHYQGVAFVQINPSGNSAKVQIRNGQLALLDSNGSMLDPLGRSGISGTVTAKKHETMVAAATEPFRLDALMRVRPAAAGGK